MLTELPTRRISEVKYSFQAAEGQGVPTGCSTRHQRIAGQPDTYLELHGGWQCAKHVCKVPPPKLELPRVLKLRLASDIELAVGRADHSRESVPLQTTTRWGMSKAFSSFASDFRCAQSMQQSSAQGHLFHPLNRRIHVLIWPATINQVWDMQVLHAQAGGPAARSQERSSQRKVEYIFLPALQIQGTNTLQKHCCLGHLCQQAAAQELYTPALQLRCQHIQLT